MRAKLFAALVGGVPTAAEPLLAAYVWRAGDLTAKSRIDE